MLLWVKAYMEGPDVSEFKSFFDAVEPELRRAHFAVFGLERGPEATAEAFAWAWETWPKARDLESPVGYLFRVGQSKTRRRRFRPVFTQRPLRTHWSNRVSAPPWSS